MSKDKMQACIIDTNAELISRFSDTKSSHIVNAMITIKDEVNKACIKALSTTTKLEPKSSVNQNNSNTKTTENTVHTCSTVKEELKSAFEKATSIPKVVSLLAIETKLENYCREKEVIESNKSPKDKEPINQLKNEPSTTKPKPIQISFDIKDKSNLITALKDKGINYYNLPKNFQLVKNTKKSGYKQVKDPERVSAGSFSYRLNGEKVSIADLKAKYGFKATATKS